MRRKIRTTMLLVVALLAGTLASFGQPIDLSVAGPTGTALEWLGPQANARAGASLFRADMSGDVDRVDLIAGAPGAGPNGEGQVFVLFMGPSYVTDNIATATSVKLTGEAAGDQFGAAT